MNVSTSTQFFLAFNLIQNVVARLVGFRDPTRQGIHLLPNRFVFINPSLAQFLRRAAQLGRPVKEKVTGRLADSGPPCRRCKRYRTSTLQSL